MKPRARIRILAALVAAACASDPTGGGDLLVVSQIDVQPPGASIIVDGTQQLTATPKTSSGITVPNRTATWSSSDLGVATVSTSGLVTGLAVGQATITARVDDVTADVTVNVAPKPVASVTVEPPQVALQVGGAQQLQATARDAQGQPLQDRPITFVSDNPGVASVSTLGLVVAVAPGTTTVRATSEGRTGTSAITVSPRVAARLGFLTHPANGTAGLALAPFRVAVQDDIGTTIPDAITSITLSIADNPGGASLGGTVTVNAVAGIATFSTVVLDRSGAGYTLRAGAAPLSPALSNPFSITAAAASRLAVTTQPSAVAQTGLPLAVQPSVQIVDGSNNPVAQAGVTLTAGLASGVGVLSGVTTAVTGASGGATFTNLTLTGAAGVYRLSFNGPGLLGVVSNDITLQAGAAAKLVVLSQPSGAASGVPFTEQPQIRVTDLGGNVVVAAGIVVTAELASGPGVLSGLLTATTDAAGQATFTNLAITGASGVYVLRFTSPGLAAVLSAGVGLGSGAATHLGIVTQPSASAASGVPFAQQPAIQLRDASNNPAAQPGVTVTVVIAGGGGTLLGTGLANTDATGTATFTDVGISGTVGPRTLTFSVAGIADVTSGTITLTAGAAATIAANSIVSQSATVASAVATPPSVLVTDASGNPVSGTSVTFAVTAGGGTIVPAGPAVIATDANGVATLTSWTLGTVAGNNNNALSATATGLAGSPVTFTSSGTAGAAAAIVANSVTAQAATVGTLVAEPPSARVNDAHGNRVAGVNVTFTLTAGGGTISPASPAVIATNASGVATLTSWRLGPVAGVNNNRVTAAAAGLAGSPVAFLGSGNAGAATTIAAASVTSQSATVATAVGAPPSVLVTDGVNPIAGVSVAFAVTAGGGTTVPASPVIIVTGANGQATLTSWTLGTTAGTNNNTVTATASGLGGSPVTFTASATAGAATTIVANSAQAQSATVGTAVAARPSVRVNDTHGNPVSGVSVTFTLTAGGGAISPASPAVLVTAANGVATLTSWTLGTAAGTNNNTVTATAALGGSPVTFNASGTAGGATNITALSALSQSATAGTAVAADPSVRVTDTHGNPVSGSPVAFAVTAGGGSTVPASPAAINTNALGIATLTSWTLGSTAGTNNNTLTVTAAGLIGSPIVFTASATAGAATTLTSNSSVSQSATVATAVAADPSVRATDINGNPVSGVNVTFTVTAGGGTTSPASPAVIATNASGIATLTSWTLGTTAGTNNNTVTATAAFGSPVVFTASGTAGAATTLTGNSALSQSAPVGTAVGADPSVRATDTHGNPVTGVNVTFTVTAGGGTTSPASPAVIATGVNGVATLTSWTVGPTAGTNNNTVTATAAFGSPVVFTASGTVGAATNIDPNSDQSQSATVATAVTDDPSVLVTDTNGNPVSGVNVTFTVTAGGGTTSPASPAVIATNASGIATLTSWTLGTTAGTNNNTVTATAAFGSPVVFTATATAGAATTLTSNSLTTQPGTVATPVGADPSVRATDTHGNPVTGQNVTFTVTAGGGTTSPASPAVIATGVNGVATLTSWTLGTTAGTDNNSVTATAAFGSAVVFTASAAAGTANTIAANSLVSQSATPGASVGEPPSVLVTDVHGNPKAGVTVTFTLTADGTGGTISPGSPAALVTDANGEATLTTWTLGTDIGTDNNTVTATATVPNGSPVTFNASGTAEATRAAGATAARTLSRLMLQL